MEVLVYELAPTTAFGFGQGARSARPAGASSERWRDPPRLEGDHMHRVTSSDGTTIAFNRLGDGPPVILVCGGSTDRMANAPLAELLAEHFTVLNYDRRGRGDSGDTAPYAVEREVEDLDAVIAEAGGSASVYGTSSGAALAMEAAASGLAVRKLALWEPPLILGESRRPPADLAERYDEMIAAGRRGAAGVLPSSADPQRSRGEDKGRRAQGGFPRGASGTSRARASLVGPGEHRCKAGIAPRHRDLAPLHSHFRKTYA